MEPDRPISRYGYARCPLHDDQVPSLKLYEQPEEGWYCWSCARGGDLIEYAAWRHHGCRARELAPGQFSALTRWLVARLGAAPLTSLAAESLPGAGLAVTPAR